MKVLKIDINLIRLIEEIINLLGKIGGRKTLKNKIEFIKQSVLEIKKLHDDLLPIEISFLDNLLLELNDILRRLIIKKINFHDYTILLNKFSQQVKKLAKNSYYDFSRLCGQCASCCDSPHVFSFEYEFIEKNRKNLKRKGLSYVVKNNSKTGLCSLYNQKNKKCQVYDQRPLDCTIFPFSFEIHQISSKNTKPKRYIFLSKATQCDIMNRLSLNDSLEAMEMICYVLSNISLEEALEYSKEIDPRKMRFDLSVPYDERKMYYKALKQIFTANLYLKR